MNKSIMEKHTLRTWSREKSDDPFVVHLKTPFFKEPESSLWDSFWGDPQVTFAIIHYPKMKKNK